MEKKQAQDQIKEVLQHKFDLNSFGLFIANLVNQVDRSRERGWAGKQYIYADYREHIKNYKRLGLYTDPNGEEVEILVVKTETLAKLDRARTALRNFVVKWLQDTDNKSRARDYALAAFYSGEDHGEDWRFSFIKIEHEAYRDDKGKVKSRKEITPARRYSYLVGKHENSYTARKQLLPLLETDYANPTVADIESAFSVEKVTGEFFQQYRELYIKLADYFNREKAVKAVIEGEGLEISRFTKKLLGQIVFLYFLQKKGWLGAGRKEKWGRGDKKFLGTLFDKAREEGKNFYGDYLQYLFYEALAKERPDSTEPGYYPRFACKIPFLNGGLFEADYDWQNRPVAIPDTLFHNRENNKAGDQGTGILDVFDRYNFTVKEDEPLEKEVAVDPEMLGKVFENMLEIAERKSTGAYYTPREIVHYMCRESLIQYLDRAINGGEEICPRTTLERLIREGHLALENDKLVIGKGKETDTYKFQLPQSLRTHAALLDQSLADIKICDPAIGSGAFPVGLLHEIVNARLLLRAYLSDKNQIKSAYDLKRHAIQTSIYGVDSDASAVDIARLRLWLSLIVDEDDYDRIDALPNLDYKIVCGNSLVGIANGTLRDRNLEIEIEKIGIRLKEWNIYINYGVKTGFNDAFLIDGKRKDELIAKDPKSADIIKPVLQGRDIKRYEANYADSWLIATFPALKINIDNYPAIRDFLKSFGKKLNQTGEEFLDEDGISQKSRKKTGNAWFETQDQIAYYREFEKEKIIYAEIVFDSAFYYDIDHYFAEATAFIITGVKIKYLTAMLNSRFLTYAFKKFYAGGDLRGNTFRYKKDYLEKLPVPKIEKESQKPFEILVDYVMLTKKSDHKLQSAFFEQLIDGLVFELYFAGEIKAAKKEIRLHLGELQPLTANMPTAEKLAAIQTEFQRLYDPSHPVRNNLETLDAVEPVRIVLQALEGK